MQTHQTKLDLSCRWDIQIAHVIGETEPNWILHVGGKESIIPLYCGYLFAQAAKPGAVLTIGKDLASRPKKENVYYLDGNPNDSSLIDEIKREILPEDKVAVVLEYRSDIDPLTQIQRYAPFVTEGSYMVLDERLGNFASEYVEFEPHWLMLHASFYLRKVEKFYQTFAAGELNAVNQGLEHHIPLLTS